jgi:hypothetical protein
LCGRDFAYGAVRGTGLGVFENVGVGEGEVDLTSIQSVGMGAVMAPPNNGVGCEVVEVMVSASERIGCGEESAVCEVLFSISARALVG